MSTRHRYVRMVTVGASLALAACASGESILDAGNDGTRPQITTVTTATTIASPGGSVGAPTTVCVVADCGPAASAAPPAAPTTVCVIADCAAPRTSTTAAASSTTADVDTTAARLDGFAAPGAMVAMSESTDFAPCPVDALDDAGGPVTVEFWHAMQSAQGDALELLTAEYNSSQDRVVVELQNQNGYEELVDEYFQASTEDRPELAQMPEFMLQQMADANTVVSTSACIQTAGFDLSPFLPRALLAYQTGGVQWGMPFNISSPVLFYNKAIFEAAGLDPEAPPITLDQVREYSQQIVDSGAATYGIALDSGINSGGAWFVEHWLARAGLPYTDNDNGRTARATQVLFDTPETVELLTFAQALVEDELAIYVGEDPRGIDGLLALADREQPAAMTIASSGALGGVLEFVEGGAIEGITASDIGVGPMPGPSDVPSAIVGGAALFIVRDQGDAEAAAAWDFVQYLVSAEVQSTWADASGYAPVRDDATDVEPLATTFAEDPRFSVAYDQVNFTADDFSAVGPVLGPMRQVRQATAEMMAAIYGGADVAEAVTAAADQANLLIIDYDNRN